MAEVIGVTGTRGDYTRDGAASARATSTSTAPPAATAPRRSTAEIPNPFNYGLDRIKAAYLPHAMAYPQRYVLDPSIVGTPDGEKAKAACKYGAIDLAMQEETIELKAGAVIWATGWKPYDAAKIQPYGYGRFAERRSPASSSSASPIRTGRPAAGSLRPSDGKEAKNIAFIQCAGSRDENHLRHCSRICCMASLKQTQYVREAYGDDAQVDDLLHRHPRDRPLRGFLPEGAARPDGEVRQVQGRAHRAGRQDRRPDRCTASTPRATTATRPSTTSSCWRSAWSPRPTASRCPTDVIVDSSGFIEGSADGGQQGAGAAASPLDVNRAVQSATAAALRAIQVDAPRRPARRRHDMAEMKTAAYICSGCGIGDALDTAQLAKIAQQEGKMALVREHAFLCSGEGVQTIRDDIEKEGVTHVMIAACSRRAKTEAFHFPDGRDGARQPARRRALGRSPTGDEHDEVAAGNGRRLRAHGLRRS